MITLINFLLDKLFRRPKPILNKHNENEILNYCLSLAQEWGPNWMQPIDERLSHLFPTMDIATIKFYSKVATVTMENGYSLVSKLIESHGIDKAKIAFKSEIVEKYNWIDGSNVNHIFSTGSYYHYK